MRNQKVAKDFIPGSTTQIDPATGRLIEGGTTLNDINFQVVKRIGKDFEINGNFAFEHWKAPIYLPGQQTVTTTTIKLTWYPTRKLISTTSGRCPGFALRGVKRSAVISLAPARLRCPIHDAALSRHGWESTNQHNLFTPRASGSSD